MRDEHKACSKRKLYGMATLGERGQVVIPAEAREDMGLNKSDKLLVFGFGKDMLAMTKLSGLEDFASMLEERLGEVREIIRKNKEQGE